MQTPAIRRDEVVARFLPGAAVSMGVWILVGLIGVAAFALVASGSADAQQREAVLEKIDVPGAVFDLVIAMPKTLGVTFDFGESPDAYVIYLVGGKLALGFEDEQLMFRTLESLGSPVGSLQVQGNRRDLPTPFAVYKVPKDNDIASRQ